MNNRACPIYLITLCISVFLYPGLVSAEENAPSRPMLAQYQVASIFDTSESGFTLRTTQFPSNYVLAKVNKPSTQEVCESDCKKVYRRCYSQGNRPGTPEVNGGASCTEQQQTCLRACAK